eukprot:scaffold53913_cov33-Tisochrysis_lutea.AAC.2
MAHLGTPGSPDHRCRTTMLTTAPLPMWRFTSARATLHVILLGSRISMQLLRRRLSTCRQFDYRALCMDGLSLPLARISSHAPPRVISLPRARPSNRAQANRIV